MPDDIMLDEPETRIEKLLAAAAGENIQLDEPQTRIEKYLYKIAQNSGGGGGVLEVTDEEGTLNHTWQEIADAVASTGAVIVKYELDDFIGATVVTSCVYLEDNGNYFVGTGMNDEYYAETADDYPSLLGIDDLSPVV